MTIWKNKSKNKTLQLKDLAKQTCQGGWNIINQISHLNTIYSQIVDKKSKSKELQKNRKWNNNSSYISSACMCIQ